MSLPIQKVPPNKPRSYIKEDTNDEIPLECQVKYCSIEKMRKLQEEERLTREQQRAAKREFHVINPPLVDGSLTIQGGYEYSKSKEGKAIPAVGATIHLRPSFNLGLQYSFQIEGGVNEKKGSLALKHNVGATFYKILSKKHKENLGIKFAFTYGNELYNSIDQKNTHLVGFTTGLEYGNYSPRFFLNYSYLSNLNEETSHQFTLGVKWFFRTPQLQGPAESSQ
ncbi:MAG: hypothetical protein HQ564_01325 [Candidatus Saganbacteria bacterium]|nr:hypothetical protein [Candidatus Saganbacteria bacterium]